MRSPSLLPTFRTTSYVVGAMLLLGALAASWWVLCVVPVTEVLRDARDPSLVREGLLLVALVTLLAGSAMTYLAARVGAGLRWRSHLPASPDDVVRTILRNQPSVTVLVPSYKEEPKVVWRTIMSAALQEFPDLRVVVLVDDPPDPTDENDVRLLRQVTEATRWVGQALSRMACHLEQSHLAALRSLASARPHDGVPQDVVATLLKDYRMAVERLLAWADDVSLGGHESAFFSEHVIGDLAAELDRERQRLQARLSQGTCTGGDVHAGYRRLRWVFTADVSTFERKRYQCLSHEANKAMNINAYLSLMGGSPRQCPGEPFVLDVPRTDYVLTLDADSVLLMGYCARLVEVMERPEYRDAAVIQTPYRAFPGAVSALERVAGATTDLLHVIHQGKTYFGATFWVGANAVIRTAALEDIAETTVVDGLEVTKYVQDRTVIEDTESTVDLLGQGWRLVNYPEPLAFSATPPDYGSLVIQRRRWANGGLLIVPKLVRYTLASRDWASFRGVVGLGLQMNYLASIAVTNLCFLVLLLYPFDPRLVSWPVLAMPVAYFVAMTWDLMLLGYRPGCVLRVYAMNLLLLPVNLAGVAMSVRQAITSRKTPFVRTPKVADRVRAPAVYILMPAALGVTAVFLAARAGADGRIGGVVVSTAVAVLLGYALVAFVTPRAAVSDVRARLRPSALPPMERFGSLQ